MQYIVYHKREEEDDDEFFCRKQVHRHVFRIGGKTVLLYITLNQRVVKHSHSNVGCVKRGIWY